MSHHYQYKIIDLPYSIDPDHSKLVKALDDLGAEGWEAFHLRPFCDGHQVFLRREKEAKDGGDSEQTKTEESGAGDWLLQTG